MIADDYRIDFAFAADEQADLAVNIAGKKRQPQGELRADDIFRGNAFTVKALYLLDLSGAQSCRISEYFIDSRFSRSICHCLSPAGGAHPAHAGGIKGVDVFL
jgi:hypothetical protein